LDFTGPFLKSQSGNSYILVIVEAFSRYVKLIPTKDQTAETASAELFNYITDHVVPNRILTDQGACFVSRLFKHVCSRFGVKNITTTAYHPMANGITERVNRVIKQLSYPNLIGKMT